MPKSTTRGERSLVAQALFPIRVQAGRMNKAGGYAGWSRGDMFSRVVSAAATVVLAGAFWAPTAYAAAPAMPPLKLASGPSASLDRSGYVVNFNLGGLMSPGLLQDATSLRPTAI